MNNITTRQVSEIIKPRPLHMHKGSAGRVLIIAGSRGMAGAAVLAARGALYSGAGLIKVSVPDDLFNILQITVPEVMCINRDFISWEDYDVIAIGPGIGNTEENSKLILEALDKTDAPIVIDADGINSLCTYGNLSAIKNRQGNTVLTPHPGEARRILDKLGVYANSRIDVAREIADETRAITLLKGMDTIICGPDGNMAVNPTGNPGMATGGSGDVLTGIIAGLIAQCQAGKKANDREGIEEYMSSETYDAVCAGAFVHGLAGDIAAENIGEMGMTAADIADAISMALKEFA